MTVDYVGTLIAKPDAERPCEGMGSCKYQSKGNQQPSLQFGKYTHVAEGKNVVLEYNL